MTTQYKKAESHGNSSTLLEALEKHLPSTIAENQLQVKAAGMEESKDSPGGRLGKDEQDDYEFSRNSYRDLVHQSNQAIEAMLNLALQSEHPRAFEVLSGMLKNTSEITDKLMDLQKKKKEIQVSQVPPGFSGQGGPSNNFFIGSTADLQKHLIKKLQEKNVTDSNASNDPS
jgi:hypothetical protein